MALAHLGDRRIIRLDEDAQTADALVRYCAEFYVHARTETLAAHRWTFAKYAQELTQATATVIGFTYAHALPPDLMRLMKCVPGTEVRDTAGLITGVTFGSREVDQFRIVGPNVWSDTQYLAVEYIRDVTDPTSWTPHFQSAVSRLLASFLAGPLADNPDEVSKQKQIYETVDLPNAQYYDAVQDGSGENSDRATRLSNSPTLRSRYQLAYGQTDPSDIVY